jgi:hypothetical protein
VWLCVQSFHGMKQRAKKAASHDKLQRKQTGGGTSVPEVDDVNNKILALLGNQALHTFHTYNEGITF